MLNLQLIRQFLFSLFLLLRQYNITADNTPAKAIAVPTTIKIITVVCDSLLLFEVSDPCLPPVGAYGVGAQSLSGRGAQYCLDSVKPCSLHSATSSSWSSEQQCEHF